MMRRSIVVGAAVLAVAVPGCAQATPDQAGAPDAAASPARSPARSSAASSPVASAPAATKTVRTLFFGDSYFVGHDDFPASKSWAAVTAGRLGWASVIRGAGGTGFVGANPDYDLPNYLGQIADGAFDGTGKVQWVVVEGGTNDYGQPLSQVKTNAGKVLTRAHADFPKAQIVLVGPMSPDDDYTNDRPIATALSKVAAKRKVPFIDVTDWLGGQHMQANGEHPTAYGYKILGKKLAKKLRGLGA